MTTSHGRGADAEAAPAVERRLAVAIMVAAFGVRLAWGLAAGVVPGATGFDDAAWYHSTAIGLTRGYGYVNPLTTRPTAAWPPGYPLVLAAVYRILGAGPGAAVALNALAGAFTCGVVWRLGRRLIGPRGGLVAAALLAAFPSQIFFAALVLSETLFTALVVGLVLAGVRLLDRNAGAGAWLLWGVAAGLTALVRAEAILLALAPAVTVATTGARRAALSVLAATALGALLALAPWALRNARVFGSVVPTSTGFGRTFWIGHNPDADGGMRPALQAAMTATMTTFGDLPPGPAGELATDRLLLRDALAFARAHPGRELALVGARVYHLFRGDHVWQAWYSPGAPRLLPSESARRWLGRIGNLYYLVAGGLALAGWFLRGPVLHGPALSWRLVDVTIAVWIGLFALVYGDPRFHHVLMPLVCLFAAVTLTRRPAAPGRRTLGVATAA